MTSVLPGSQLTAMPCAEVTCLMHDDDSDDDERNDHGDDEH